MTDGEVEAAFLTGAGVGTRQRKSPLDPLVTHLRYVEVEAILG
jgi:hypothetical protein